MKEFIAKYQKTIIGVGAISVLTICYFQQKELAKLRSGAKIEVLGGGDIGKAETIDSLTKLNDSLQTELFNATNAAGRYELSLQYLEEVNPKAAKQFDTYLRTQTE